MNLIGNTGASRAPDLYLNLMKQCLTRLLFPDCSVNLEMIPTGQFDPEARRLGQDWPSEAETMVGLLRLDNLEYCISRLIADGVVGDLVETGVWRGGASIFMRAALKAFGDEQRTVWLFDSFEGLPQRDPERYPHDEKDNFATFNEYLGISLDTVMNNFKRYGLLDDQVRFVKGWFRDTMPSAAVGPIGLLRLDGDMYESTIQVLDALYPRVSPGGFVVVDDFGCLANCRAAVEEFRSRHGICEEIHAIDWTGVYWRKPFLTDNRFAANG